MGKRPFPLVAVVVMGLAVACNGGEEPPRATTPEPSLSGTAAALRTITPAPAVTQAPSPAQPVTLEEGAPVTEWGTYVVEAATAKVWKVGDFGAFLWSPDGKALMLARASSVADREIIEEGGIYLSDIERGLAGEIFSGDVDGAAWSPDGGQIAFVRGTRREGVYIINRDGSRLRRLSERHGSRSLTWSPAGGLIAFVDQTFTSGPLRIEERVYLLDVFVGQLSEITEEIGPAYHIGSLVWSSDGRQLAILGDYRPAEGEQGRSPLYVYDVAARNLTELAEPVSGPLLWSPDGSSVLFGYGEPVPFPGYPELAAGRQWLHVIDVDPAGHPLPLALARNPSWSPDGTRIAYLEEGCIADNWDLYTIDPDGGSSVRLTNTPETFKEGPFWSPTGATIAFKTSDDLILLDVESGEFRTLASGGPQSGRPGIHLHEPPWSPDGRYIMFSAGGGHGVCD